MKVINNQLLKEFCDVNKGECFVFENETYIKTVYCNNFNAVDIESGNMDYFDSTIEVEYYPNAVVGLGGLKNED